MLMVLVDGKAEDKLTNQHQLKLGLKYPIGQFTFRFTDKYHRYILHPINMSFIIKF